MDSSNQLPLGFGIALLQNEKSLIKFNAMTKAQQKELIANAKFVRSKQEMISFVDHI